MTIMITGGAGYIGSHVCVELLRAGHSIVILDNFCNSHREVVNRIGHIAGGPRRSSTVISAIASC